ELLVLLDKVKRRTHLLALIDTLEYLVKGGRIGRARALVGSILDVKPLVTVRDGEVYPVARVRSRAKAVERLYDFVKGFSPIEAMAVMYTTTLGEAELLAQRLAPFSPSKDVMVTRLGSVVGTYVGPKGLGVAVMEGEA
ncbi:MAG: DegV family EDD domain-containing protein, partial [Chloroflexi bacterium]|nr:DegV family EDD domain-containing protein [Chloroflexota bacterium]